MELKDLILGPIWLIIIYATAYFIKINIIKSTVIKKYFIPGLTVKIIGAICFALIYKYYYGYGDSISYYTSASYLSSNILESPGMFLRILITPLHRFSDELNYFISKSPSLVAFRSESNFMVVRLGAFLDVFGRTYIVTNILSACISFIGIWKLYIAVFKLHPEFHKGLAIAVLFIPTVFFWGSPMMKDTISISALGYLFYCANEVFIWKRNVLINVCAIMIFAIIISLVKLYIVAAFVPAYFTFLTFYLINRIRSKILQFFVIPFFLISLISISIYVTARLADLDSKYSLENITTSVDVIQRDILRNSSKDAAYSFGEIDYPIIGIARVFPLAVVTTFYRPFIWEVANPVMLLSALENTFLILLSLYLLYKPGLRKALRITLSEPLLYFCNVYAIILGFALGISTYNFGTLVRYKAPLIIFFAMNLLILYYSSKSERYTSKV